MAAGGGQRRNQRSLSHCTYLGFAISRGPRLLATFQRYDSLPSPTGAAGAREGTTGGEIPVQRRGTPAPSVFFFMLPPEKLESMEELPLALGYVVLYVPFLLVFHQL